MVLIDTKLSMKIQSDKSNMQRQHIHHELFFFFWMDPINFVSEGNDASLASCLSLDGEFMLFSSPNMHTPYTPIQRSA